MRNERTNLHQWWTVVAMLVAILWAWGGAPLLAGGGDAGPRVEAARGDSGGLFAALPGWLSQWLSWSPASGARTLSAPAAEDPTADEEGGGAMDPNGSPTSGEPSVDQEGGAGMDPNG